MTAYLCKMFNLDPKGTADYNKNVTDVPVILCHQDAARLKLGSDHGDVYGWFKRYGKTMDDVRERVAEILKEDARPIPTPPSTNIDYHSTNLESNIIFIRATDKAKRQAQEEADEKKIAANPRDPEITSNKWFITTNKR